jgi:hypothetical protein
MLVCVVLPLLLLFILAGRRRGSLLCGSMAMAFFFCNSGHSIDISSNPARSSIGILAIISTTTRSPRPRPRPPVRHISAIHNAMIPRRKVVALAGRAVALVGGGVVDGHVVVLEHLADLREALGGGWLVSEEGDVGWMGGYETDG